MGLHVRAPDARQIRLPNGPPHTAPPHSIRVRPNSHPATAAASGPDPLTAARCQQRKSLQLLADALHTLKGLADDQPAAHEAAAQTIRALAADVLRSHRHALRALTNRPQHFPSQPSSAVSAHTALQTAVHDDLRTVLHALDDYQTSLPPAPPHAHPRPAAAPPNATPVAPETGRWETHPRPASCTHLNETVRTTKWLLTRLIPANRGTPPLTRALAAC